MSENPSPLVVIPVGALVKRVTLSKTFRDARKRDAEAIRAMRQSAREAGVHE